MLCSNCLTVCLYTLNIDKLGSSNSIGYFGGNCGAFVGHLWGIVRVLLVFLWGIFEIFLNDIFEYFWNTGLLGFYWGAF